MNLQIASPPSRLRARLHGACMAIVLLMPLLAQANTSAELPDLPRVAPETLEGKLPPGPEIWLKSGQVVDVAITLKHSESGRVVAVQDVHSPTPMPAGFREKLEAAALNWVVAARQTADCRLESGIRMMQLRYAPQWKRPFVVEPLRKEVDRRGITNWAYAEEKMFGEVQDKGVTSLTKSVQLTAWLKVKGDGEVTEVDMRDVRTEPAARTVQELNLIKRFLRVALMAARFAPVAADGESRFCWRMNTGFDIRSETEANLPVYLPAD